MCGIVGIAGDSRAAANLLEGLRRLEYRGYDSAGLAMQDGGHPHHQAQGQDPAAGRRRRPRPARGTCGIAHTRWATHGEPNQINAHPHQVPARWSVVHNGIIENFQVLKRELSQPGHEFVSETDTEVLAHLIHDQYDGNLEEAVRRALNLVEGTYGIAVMHADEPGKIVGARRGSPLVVGVGDGFNVLASDVAAILGHTKQVIYLDDWDLVVLTADGVQTYDMEAMASVDKEIQEITWDLDQIQKSGYPHFMLKEIFEQPETIRDAFRGRVIPDRRRRQARRPAAHGLGAGEHPPHHHPGLRHQLPRRAGGRVPHRGYARIPVEVEYASEFRYRSPIIEPGTLCLVSQSGETIDTLEPPCARPGVGRQGGRHHQRGGLDHRPRDRVRHLHPRRPGDRRGQHQGLHQPGHHPHPADHPARPAQHLSAEHGMELIEELQKMPDKIRRVLDQSDEIAKIAAVYKDHANCLYLGRGINYPIALEGALKLKEISYIHAEGYPAAEMKHGPIALIDPDMPVVVISTRDELREDPRQRAGGAGAQGQDHRHRHRGRRGDHRPRRPRDHHPACRGMMTPLLSVIPLQLLAYHIAVLRGEDVDQPRNLAKAVTVE